MAADQITLTTNSRKVNERSSVVMTARFRNRATAADVTPTNVKYRLDDAGTGQITDWTTVTPGTSVSVTLTPTQTQILNCARNLEAKFISFAADYGLATEYRETFRFDVRNQPYLT